MPLASALLKRAPSVVVVGATQWEWRHRGYTCAGSRRMDEWRHWLSREYRYHLYCSRSSTMLSSREGFTGVFLYSNAPLSKRVGIAVQKNSSKPFTIMANNG